MKLRLSPRARQDLREIGSYLHSRNPTAAERVRAAIQAHLRRIAAYPEAGRAIGRGVQRSVIPRLPYLIFYRVDEAADALMIVTIRHAARRDEN